MITNSYDLIKSFEVKSEHENVKDLLREGRFQVVVNSQTYDVYPDYS